MSEEIPDLGAALQPLLAEDFEESLSDSALKARRNLLAACVLGWLLTVTGLEVTEINFLGATASGLEIGRLLAIVAMVILYLIANFGIYAYSDYQTRKIRLYKRKTEGQRAFRKHGKAAREVIEKLSVKRDDQNLLNDPTLDALVSAKDSIDLMKRANLGSSMRLFFDVWTPMVIAWASLILVTSASLGIDVFELVIYCSLAGLIILAVYMFAIRKKILRVLYSARRKFYTWRANRISIKLKRDKPTGKDLEKLKKKVRRLLFRSIGINPKSYDKSSVEK